MKTVHTNGMVRHLWANQSQPFARSGNGNLTLNGSRLVSYTTPIANMVEDKDGNRVALITTNTYSRTTTGNHIPKHRDVSHITHFYVPHLLLPTGDASFGNVRRDWPNETFEDWIVRRHAAEHTANIAHMVKAMVDLIAAWKRKITEPYGLNDNGYPGSYHHPRSIERMIRDYAAAFALDLPADMPDAEALTAEVIAHRAAREARNNTPAKVAGRARRQAARDEADRAEREKQRSLNEAHLARWLAGDDVGIYMNTPTNHNGAYLRVRGDRIETSLGAAVPLKHGLRLAHMCAWQRKVGHEYTPPIPVMQGSFHLTHVSAEGNARVGCHLLEWEQIEDCARRAGIDLSVQSEPNISEAKS